MIGASRRMHLSCELTLLAASDLTHTQVTHPCFAPSSHGVCLKVLLLIRGVCVACVKAGPRHSGAKRPPDPGWERWWGQQVQYPSSLTGRKFDFGDFLASSI